MSVLRIVFAGTPAFAAAHLAAISDSAHEIVAVYTQPDRPSGRGKKLSASPVKEIALTKNIPVYQPSSLRDVDAQNQLAQLDADVLVVVAYGLILPKEVLAIPKFGCINVHASLLPRWRGAAPIERALLAGDKVSGVTIMQMDEGLDTGDMLLKTEVPIKQSDTRDDIENNLCSAGQQAIVAALDNLEELLKNPEKQDDSQSCYAEKLAKAEALIDWNSPAETVNRQVRVGVGRFPAYSYLNGQRLRILEVEVSQSTFDSRPGTIVDSNKDSFIVQCGELAVSILQIQLPGKNVVSVRDILNSKPELFAVGKTFTATEKSN
ncbi:MAG: methionyl-tRNA formyltransferase [Pseudomonadales bacterium]|nr:methionyl-tRNA formyltransferase [Pseudomonadales bacterium]